MLQKEFKLSEVNPVELANEERVKEQFVKTLCKMHRMEEADAEAVYEREALYYKKALLASQKLQSCNNISLYSAFLEIAVTGLSIQPGGKSEAYLESRGAKQPDGSYQNAAVLQISAYGELSMRIRAGQIIRMSNPIVLYEGDYFQPKTNARGELFVDYQSAIPRKSTSIFGCYVTIYLPHNGIDFKWLLKDDIERLRKYSERGMGGKANALYAANGSQIDPGFLEAKTIKHAMRAYTKLRVGEAVSFDEDVDLNDPSNQPGDTFGPERTSERPEQPQATQGINVNDKEDIF
jgi:recombinational DNA repair protein RecT